MDLLLLTLRNLRANALRFFLTSLGIVWGAFMLTYLSASMEGIDRHYDRALKKIGPRVIFMGPGAVLKNRVGERGAREVELEDEDAMRLESLATVEFAAPNIYLWNQIVRAGRRTKLLTVQGVTHDTAAIRNFQTAEGRFITPGDLARTRRVAFLGARAAERLFGRAPALGEWIQIQSVGFRVVGVAVEKGEQLVNPGNPDDLMVLVPYTTAQRWFTQTEKLDEIVISPVSREVSWDSIRHTRQLVGLHHDFSPELETALWFFNIQEILSTLYAMNLALRIFIVAAGVTTLIVGAVGVMNIMLVVVGERTNEIGLRKAVGASSRAIFAQFLAEAGAVCGLSGLLGAALGVGLTRVVAALLPEENPMTSVPVLDTFTVIAIVGSLVVVGVVAGVAPALRAARVAPAEALRAV